VSLNSIFNIAQSGLMVSQQQLRVVSDNVANVNTPGYIRKTAQQVSQSSNGVGTGVDIGRISLATDRFLQAASLKAGAEASRQGVRSELYDQIQSLFGDPGGDSSLFSRIDEVFTSFASLSESAASAPLRQEAIYKAAAIFQEASRISSQIQKVREDAESRIGTAIQTANGLLEQIEALNLEISRARVTDADATGAETIQSTLIGQLSSLMDINITPRGNGGVSIRTNSGILLAGAGAARLEHRQAGAVNAESAFDDVWITEPGGQRRSFTDGLKSGEIKGLIELRDVEAMAVAERLGELMTRLADELNRAHNANASVPAPSTLTGRNTGQSLETAVGGFTGTTTVAVTDAATGAIVTSAEITFSGATITVNGVAADPSTFLATLNAQLGGSAVASFANGRLSLATGTTDGIAIADDPATPSIKAGRGFSHYFGLNDLVATDRTANYDIGLEATSQHGFPAGETISLRVADAEGNRLREVTIAVPAGAGTVAELLTSLNHPLTGVGRFGSFGVDAASGSIAFSSNTLPAATLTVTRDQTTQSASGVSLTELFGIGAGVRASRADGFSIRADITSDPKRLALAQLNLAAPAGTSVLGSGDGRGAGLLAAAGQNAARFQAGGGSTGGLMSISRYASDLSGEIGSRASAAKTRAESAAAIQTEAKARQSGHEGVNLDEELVAMTTYQQSFNASARMIQAAREMYDTLLGMI